MTAEPMTPEKRASRVIFENVSKFYGDVLGVNRVNLSIPPGITGLVGPNGSGKTTLMNMMVGLIQPSRGRISVLGVAPDQPEELFRKVGYASQYDAFPPGLTGYQFVESYLRVHGFGAKEAEAMAWRRSSGWGWWRPRSARWPPTARGCASASGSPRRSPTSPR